jgi:lysozyme
MLTAIVLIVSCEEGTRRLADYEVHGIDVSHYQSHIDWAIVAGQALDFAFVKATEGATLADTLFCQNWEQMKQAGLVRGAYHFYRPRIAARTQAENFTSLVELEFGDLPPVLDVEILDGADKIQLITGMRTWLFLVELKYQVKPIIYTNLKFYNKYLAGQFDEYPLWIARYNRREPVLACGRPWDFWQYGNRGRLAGIEGYVDFNVFRGSRSALDSLCTAPLPILSER